MNIFKIALPLLLSAVQLLQAPVASGDNTLEAQVRTWLYDRRETGLVLVEKFDTEGFVRRSVAGSRNMRYELMNSDYLITLTFSFAFSDQPTRGELHQKLKYVTLERLPLPGLEIPEGWEVFPRTSRSTFRQGVEILDLQDGRLTLRIKTNCFAIYGQETIFDEVTGVSRGDYFQIRNRLPLDLTMEVPIRLNE